MSNGLRVSVDRREGPVAVLRTDDGQEIRWPVADLPAGLADGDVLILTAKADGGATDDRQALARDILNEIFNAETTDQSQGN